MDARSGMIAAARQFEGCPVVWGESDCLSFAVALARHVQPLPPAPLWHGEEEARSMLAARGGLAASMRRTLAANGWRAVRPSQAPLGALGVVTGQTAAVCLGGGHWAVRIEMGWAVLPASGVRLAWAHF